MKIGITGGKGGTGKSTIATALAFELAKTKKVLLVDMDVDCPNDHLLLGIERQKFADVEQRIPGWNYDICTKCGRCGKVCRQNAIVSVKGQNPIFMEQQCNGCGACFLECPVDAISWTKKDIGSIYKGSKYNIDFLSGELKINESVSEFVVSAVKEKIDEDVYDFIIIDTAAGTHCDVISALVDCDYVLAITEPTPLGVHDLKLILGLLNKLGTKYDVVLNRYDGDDYLVKQALDKEILAKVPYSKDIVDAYANAKPIEHESIVKIARDLR